MSVSVLGCNITYFMCVLSIWLVAVHFQWCWNSASVINTLNFAMILSLMYIFYIFYIFTYFTYFSVTPKLVGRQPESNINNFILSLLRKLGWSDSRTLLESTPHHYCARASKDHHIARGRHRRGKTEVRSLIPCH